MLQLKTLSRSRVLPLQYENIEQAESSAVAVENIEQAESSVGDGEDQIDEMPKAVCS